MIPRTIFKTAGGDGASLAVPLRRNRHVFVCRSWLVYWPPGTVIEVKVMIVTRRQWRDEWDKLQPFMTPVFCGNLVFGVMMTFLAHDNPKWAEEIAEAKAAVAAERGRS